MQKEQEKVERSANWKWLTFGWLHSFLRAVMYAKILDCFVSSAMTRFTYKYSIDTGWQSYQYNILLKAAPTQHVKKLDVFTPKKKKVDVR